MPVAVALVLLRPDRDSSDVVIRDMDRSSSENASGSSHISSPDNITSVANADGLRCMCVTEPVTERA